MWIKVLKGKGLDTDLDVWVSEEPWKFVVAKKYGLVCLYLKQWQQECRGTFKSNVVFQKDALQTFHICAQDWVIYLRFLEILSI